MERVSNHGKGLGKGHEKDHEKGHEKGHDWAFGDVRADAEPCATLEPTSMRHSDLLRDLAGVDAKPIEDVVTWMAERLCSRTGSRAADVFAVAVSREHARPDATANVAVGSVANADPTNRSARAGGTTASTLAMFGRPAVLADLRPLTFEIVDGPREDTLRPLYEGDRCLLVRVHLEVAIVWVRLFDVAERFGDESRIRELVDGIDGFVRVAIRLVDPPAPSSAAGRRQRFYANVLALDPSDQIWEDLSGLCAEWTAATGASWAWLWLHNRISGAFELAACHANDPASIGLSPNDAPGRNSACDFCARLTQPIHVPDVRSWSAMLDDERYGVSCRETLERLGATSMDAVPIPQPQQNGDSADERGAATTAGGGAARVIGGVITLHYGPKARRIAQPVSSLALMGRLTGLRIRTWRSEQRAEVLHALNRLAQKHLTKIHRRQAEVRREYLNDVIDLIRQRLHVRAVSIFFRRDNEHAIECIATTGLWDTAAQRSIGPDDRLSDVTYAANENWTGRCWASGEPIIADTGERAGDETAKYADAIDGRPVLRGVLLQHPIPFVGDDSADEPALGVIRCSGHASPAFPGEDRGFDAMDLKLIGFIAQQLAPVLTTIAGRIKREREISIVKHDLYTPLNMIRDITARVDKRWRERREVREYDVRNLAFCERTASNLVDRLSIDLSRLPDLDPEPTRLAGHIIARLKNMMSDFARLENGMEIEFGAIDETIPPLKIDRELIERSIYNLLVNAVKYGAPHTTITIDARSAEAGFYLDISNYGIGLQPDELPHLFKAEYRSPRAEALAHGVGLGLTIARRAIEAHGGTITPVQAGDRTTFTIFFPRSLKTRMPA